MHPSLASSTVKVTSVMTTMSLHGLAFADKQTARTAQAQARTANARVWFRD
jgi:hypothetical protein